jgi:hypothetical protein
MRVKRQMKSYKLVFILGICLLITGITWGVTIAGNSYNQLMQTQKVPPVLGLEKRQQGYKFSLMGNNLGSYRTPSNPLEPEKAKVIIKKVNDFNHSEKLRNSVVGETRKSLVKLWQDTPWGKSSQEVQKVSKELRVKGYQLGEEIKLKLKTTIEKVLPNGEK